MEDKFMEDRIEGVSDKEVVYKFLDKVSAILNNDTPAGHIIRQGTHNGMNIKIVSKNSNKMMSIESNLNDGILNITFIDKVFDNKGYNFATLYKNNSNSCKNFLEQIKRENKKIDELLSEMLKDLDEPKVEQIEVKKKWYNKFNKLKL